MKLLFVLILFFSADSRLPWLTDIENARKIALEKDQLILLYFSGSDWCGPCIRLKKEVFESTAFTTYATAHLVLLNADFPRMKKNSQDRRQLEKNESLAEQYNRDGKFPYTVLLTANGEVLRAWDGIPDGRPDEFVKQIIQFSETGK